MTIKTPYGMELTLNQYNDIRRKFYATSRQYNSATNTAYECRNGVIYKITMSDDEFDNYKRDWRNV